MNVSFYYNYWLHYSFFTTNGIIEEIRLDLVRRFDFIKYANPQSTVNNSLNYNSQN